MKFPMVDPYAAELTVNTAELEFLASIVTFPEALIVILLFRVILSL